MSRILSKTENERLENSLREIFGLLSPNSINLVESDLITDSSVAGLVKTRHHPSAEIEPTYFTPEPEYLLLEILEAQHTTEKEGVVEGSIKYIGERAKHSGLKKGDKVVAFKGGRCANFKIAGVNYLILHNSDVLGTI